MKNINIIRVELHGTSGWFDTDYSCTSCVGVYSEDFVIFLDAGSGMRHVDSSALEGANVFILLSHLHLDHVCGLHQLSRFRPQSLTLSVMDELATSLTQLVSSPYMIDIEELPFKVNIFSIKKQFIINKTKICKPYYLKHNTPVFGYRLEFPNLKLAYCVDTCPCEAIVECANGVDLFICDAASKTAEENSPRTHLTVDEAVAFAERANVRTLVLTHFGATRFLRPGDRDAILKKLNSGSFSIVIGQDDLIFEYPK